MKQKKHVFYFIVGLVILLITYISAPSVLGAEVADALLSPDNFTKTLVVAGESITQTMVISNEGGNDLEFTFCPPSTDDDLIAHYPFNGNAADESGNGHDGTVNGASLTADRFGNTDSAYSFDGVDDYIDLGDMEEIKSVSLWVRQRARQDYDFYFGHHDFRVFASVLENGQLRFSDSVVRAKANLSMDASANHWIHVVALSDGLSSKIYVNGVDATVSSENIGPISISAVNLGRWIGDTHYFNGDLDDIHVYDRLLVESEIQALYGEPVGGGDLIAHYPFNGNADDESGNGHDGTVNGAMLTADRFGNSDRAYSFDGVDDYIDLGDMEGIKSVSLWVRQRARDDYDFYFGHHDFKVFSSIAENGRLTFGDSMERAKTSLSMDASANQWVHVVALSDGFSSKIYVNGVDATVSSGNIGSASISAVNLGRWIGDTHYFNGDLDDVYIYDYILTEAEIQDLYGESVSGDLIAHYPFNGNADDESGNGHDGTVHGAILTTDRFGNPESAYDFNGSSDYINCGNIINGFSNFTVSAWVKIENFTHYRYMGPWGQQKFDFPNISCNYHFFTATDTAYYCFGTSMRWDDWTLLNSRAKYVVPKNEWHLITQTYDGNAVRQYDNGTLINTTITGAHVLSNAWDFLIGKVCAYPGYLSTHHFDGEIDDLRIYKRALAESEIQELYGESSGDGLVAHFSFNGNANDESGNGYDGMVNGASLTADRFGNPDSAYHFDGDDDIESTDFPISETFSVSAWIDPETLSSGQCIVGKHADSGHNIFLLGLWDLDNSNGGQVEYAVHVGLKYVEQIPATMGVQHLVAVVEKISTTQSRVTLWKDGIQLYQSVVNEVIGNPAGRGWVIGQDWDGGSKTDFFHGDIDDVRIYNRALSESEIQDLYMEAPEQVCTLPDWLSIEPMSGTIPAGASMEVAVTLNASNRVAGDYVEHLLEIFDSGSGSLIGSVPVSMWVVPPAPVMVEESPYTEWKSNEVFWWSVEGPVEYWVEALAMEHCSPGGHNADSGKSIPKGWSNVKRFHDPSRWMQQSDWIGSTNYLFSGLRLNTKYQYRVKASVMTDMGRLESTWSDWVESCQVPVVRELDESRIPDSWKQEHFGASESFRGLVDSDGDGLCDFDEYIAGALPFDAQSNFEVKECSTCDEGRFVLEWDAVPDRVYSIHWTANVTEPFQLLEDNIHYPKNTYTDTVHSVESGGFYQINVRLPE